MNSNVPQANPATRRSATDPFRSAVLRGLGILLPPLLTIVIFLWVGNSVNSYLLEPMVNGARWLLVEELADIRGAEEVAPERITGGATEIDGVLYHVTSDDKLIPAEVQEYVQARLGKNPPPPTAKGVYTLYVNQKWLRPEFVVPVFLCLFVLVLYLLGKFLAAGIGRFFWNQIERLIHHVPLVRNVYSSVKQVTDFLFTEPDAQFTRVVAVEYPCKGIWSVSFVTGEGMKEICDAAGEPMISVLIPCSPMPFTGFTATVRKSETVELDITVDQALQFIVSCGVVVPPHQLVSMSRGADPNLALSGAAVRHD